MARSVYEKKAQKTLEADGWFVDYKCRPFRVAHGYNVDILGGFDLLAYKKGQLRFISIKGHAGVPSEHRQNVEQFFFPHGCVKEIWTYRLDGSVKQEVIGKSERESSNSQA